MSKSVVWMCVPLAQSLCAFDNICMHLFVWKQVIFRKFIQTSKLPIFRPMGNVLISFPNSTASKCASSFLPLSPHLIVTNSLLYFDWRDRWNVVYFKVYFVSKRINNSICTRKHFACTIFFKYIHIYSHRDTHSLTSHSNDMHTKSISLRKLNAAKCLSGKSFCLF